MHNRRAEEDAAGLVWIGFFGVGAKVG
jgi:hypothetical protein